MLYRTTYGKVLPQDVEAEEAVIGAILMDKDAMLVAANILKADDFYLPAHMTIYECFVNRFENNQAIDIITVRSDLEKQGQLAEIGGVVKLMDLGQKVASSANLELHAKIVKRHSMRRRMIMGFSDGIQRAYDQKDSIDQIYKDIDEVLDKIFQDPKQDMRTLLDIANETQKLMDNAKKNNGMIGIAMTNIHAINIATGGDEGMLMTISARPGVGKTAFGIGCLSNDIDKGIPSTFCILRDRRS